MRLRSRIACATARIPLWSLREKYSAGIQLACPAISSPPEGTPWARLAHRIINAFFVRTSNDSVHHRHRVHGALTQMRSDLRENYRIGSHVAGFRKPATQIGLSSFIPDHRHRNLRGPLIVGTIEGKRTDRIATHPLLGFFVQPFRGLRSDLHRHHWILYCSRSQIDGGRALIGGEGGIRTPDRLAPMPHFECGAFNHSATSPEGAMVGAGPLWLGALIGEDGGPDKARGAKIRPVFRPDPTMSRRWRG